MKWGIVKHRWMDGLDDIWCSTTLNKWYLPSEEENTFLFLKGRLDQLNFVHLPLAKNGICSYANWNKAFSFFKILGH